MWGIDNGSCMENLLSPLGLISYGGGGSLNGSMTYVIYSKFKNNFRYEIECDKLKKNIKDVENAHRLYLRKEKLEKINNSNDRI